MKLVKKILLIFLILFVIVQFIPGNRNKSDEVLKTDISKLYTIPVEVKTILQKACYDCHSNNTNYPWYAFVQPFRLLLDRHIGEGKDELNFSEYGNYSTRQQRNKLKLIEESLKKETMPLPSYKLMHADARLSNSQKEIIIQWVNFTRDLLEPKK